MDSPLVAKRSSPKKRLQSIIIKPRRLTFARRNTTVNRTNKRSKFQKERKQTHLNPTDQHRQTPTIEGDSDTLVLSESFDDIDDTRRHNNERGRLLQLSTQKPKPAESAPIGKPDEIPKNSIDTTKRIVRIAHDSHGTSLNVCVKPKTASIGIQVGSPFKKSRPPLVLPSPEPPLRGYWTHKVNLPFPPNQQPAHHQPQPYQQPAAQQQPTVYQQPFPYQSNASYHGNYPYMAPMIICPPRQPQSYAYPVNQPISEFTRKNRRNYVKRQKYLERHNIN